MSAARSGFGLGKLLMVIVLLGGFGLLTWATLNNWQRSGVFTFRVFEPAWWSAGLAQDPNDPQRSVLDEATSMANHAKEQLWAPGGLVDQVEVWWRQRPADPPAAGTPTTTPAAPATPAAPPVAPLASRDRVALERILSEAQASFRAGLDAYKRADPRRTASPGERQAAIVQAHASFLHAQALLANGIPAYEAVPGHDRQLALSAHQLQDYNQQLLELAIPAR